MKFVAIYVPIPRASVAARSFKPLLILLLENVQHIPETLTKRTTITGWTKDQNQPSSR